MKDNYIVNHPSLYIEKIYSGLLSMNIGIRLGAPVEPIPWTMERIEKVYGTIDNYVRPYKNFAADDDINGPVYFLKALEKCKSYDDLTEEMVGKAWLDYAREGIGMFWWGGYDVSTEHRAYMNLKEGVPAHLSGKIETNGLQMAEQIGGQIFVDTWGLVCPDNPELASQLAEKAASISHDGNGVFGAKFIAACISKAFNAKSIDEVIDAGMSVIPKDSTYAKVVDAVRDFHSQHPNDFRECMKFLQENWGYDKYQGVCHIIPNAGVCILGLLYGEGSISKSLEVTTMCGWDTDCNAGNVGTIVGVLYGLENIESKYRNPINDSVVLSGVSGYLNILDIPNYAKEIALLAYQCSGIEAPSVAQVKTGEINFDFSLSGATHNIRSSNSNKLQIRGLKEKGIAVVYDGFFDGFNEYIFYKPFYRKEDFDDERYQPVFSPKVYSGQKLKIRLRMDHWDGNKPQIQPYIKLTFSKDVIEGECVELKTSFTEIIFTIPDTKGDWIDEIGLHVVSDDVKSNWSVGEIYIDEFSIDGSSQYSFDFSKQVVEFESVTPFAHHLGQYRFLDQSLVIESEEKALSFSGNYYEKDGELEVLLTPEKGDEHYLILRAEGVLGGYYFGFSDKNKVAIKKQDDLMKTIAEIEYSWDKGITYNLKACIVGNVLSLYINHQLILTTTDESYQYGMWGIGLIGCGKAVIEKISKSTTNYHNL